MSRPWRIEYAGALYWVQSRGNDDHPVFYDVGDRSLFLELLGRMSSRFGAEVFAYALPDRGYDLLLATGMPNLSKAMHWLGTTYTIRFNIKHLRNGHLFQGRYRSILIEDARGVMELSWSIHRRSVSAEHRAASGYPFSSLDAYASGAPHPPWLETGLILDQCGSGDRYRVYREMFWTAPDEAALMRRLHHGLFYGSRDFVERIRDRYLAAGPHPDVPAQRRLVVGRGRDALLREASALLRTGHLGVSDAAGRTEERDLRMYALWRTGSFTNREIGILFGLSHSAVSRRMKLTEARCRADPGLACRVESLAAEIAEDHAGDLSACTGKSQS